VTAPLRIGIVVTDSYAIEDPDHDTPLLLAALRDRGIDAAPVVWHRDEDLGSFDLLVLRSPWDYPDRPDEFAAWLDRAGAATRVVNSPAVVRWNLDKRYLADLAQAGVAVVPTDYATTTQEARDALAAHARLRVVVKPAVSAGARDTGLFDADDPAALALAERITRKGGVAMIQPEIPELTSGAEKALYVIDGHFTHAIAKGALARDRREGSPVRARRHHRLRRARARGTRSRTGRTRPQPARRRTCDRHRRRRRDPGREPHSLTVACDAPRTPRV
jgi:hypothetical protein